MNATHSWRPSAEVDVLRLRAALYRLIRDHFQTTGALEVETPILSSAGTTDIHIESFSSRFTGHVDAGASQRWMRTSPEFAMKRLLAAGVGDCYELGRVFRNGEAGGRHNPEFTMLEWYRVGWSLAQLIDETTQLIMAGMALKQKLLQRVDVRYRDLFQSVIGLDPMRATDAQIIDAGSAIQIDPEGLTRDDWLDLLFTHQIQTAFPSTQLTVVRDYPATQCALARVAEDAEGDLVAQRFELYVGPLELANGYDELVDADEQARRQQVDQAMRQVRGTSGPPSDLKLVEALASGMPATCGVALGVDRWMMALCDAQTIKSVIAFNFQRA